MGRGLSELQKAILKMAHEQFLEKKEEENAYHRKHFPKSSMDTGFRGIAYTVYVGPALPIVDSLTDWERRERLIKLRLDPFENPDEASERVEAEVDTEVEAEVERVETTMRSVEEEVRAGCPELWEKPDDAYYHWSPPHWSHYYEDANGVYYNRFQVASFANNAAEARRYQRLLSESGLEGSYYWRGGGVLYTGEILEHVYGFEPRYKFDYWPWGQRNAIKFDPQQIGEKRYNAARASVSRALKRLYDRMLIEWGYGYATITVEGIAELTGQTVKEVCITHKINRTDGDRRLLIRGESERAPDKETTDTVAALQNMWNPPPPPLADAFYSTILEEVAHRGGVTEEEVKEAFEDALRRIKDVAKEETVNDTFEPKVS